VWFGIHIELCRESSPEQFIAACERGIDGDWTLALPVLDDLLSRDEFERALAIVRRCVIALLPRDGEQWNPAKTLLSRALWHSDAERESVLALLSTWQLAARGAGDARTAAALAVQAVVFRNWEDGDSVLQAIKDVQGSFPDTADLLFVDWRERVASRSVGSHDNGSRSPDRNWVSDLADAARVGGDSGEGFVELLRRWIEDAGATPSAFDGNRAALATLTLDLGHDDRLSRRSPALLQLLARRVECVSDEELGDWRRRQLTLLGAHTCLDEAMEVWTHNAERLVPDPALATNSRYDACADGLAVLRELDQASYARLLEAWQSVHRRRRNLWSALRERGLP